MPVMDGFETTRHLRDRERQKQVPRTPIVALTANALVGYRQACLDADMDDYVAKPIDLDRLGNVLDRWVPQSAGTPSQQDQDEVGQQSA
ncbi:MAG: response regulator, partial [Cyanobacteria bacterium HKST-UBA05]|nr:response regulator [Cyanobacteria bacterium HKST-UBA05]